MSCKTVDDDGAFLAARRVVALGRKEGRDLEELRKEVVEDAQIVVIGPPSGLNSEKLAIWYERRVLGEWRMKFANEVLGELGDG